VRWLFETGEREKLIQALNQSTVEWSQLRAPETLEKLTAALAESVESLEQKWQARVSAP
jgi:hypothetical protein